MLLRASPGEGRPYVFYGEMQNPPGLPEANHPLSARGAKAGGNGYPARMVILSQKLGILFCILKSQYKKEVRSMRLYNKVALITGGSRGIGLATAKAFLKEGAIVVIAASNRASAAKAVEELQKEFPHGRIGGVSPDLSSLESVRDTFKYIRENFGCVDILVNNAGVSESTPFIEYKEEDFDRVMDLNVKGVFNATRAAAECMVRKGKGVILNTSSMVSIYGQSAGIAYPASKFAVNGLTVSLARELGPKGIRVNAVAPGITETDMMKAVPKEIIDPMIAQIPLRRLGKPEDIANAFVFLASDEASYITGVVLSVDGMARS